MRAVRRAEDRVRLRPAIGAPHVLDAEELRPDAHRRRTGRARRPARGGGQFHHPRRGSPGWATASRRRGASSCTPSRGRSRPRKPRSGEKPPVTTSSRSSAWRRLRRHDGHPRAAARISRARTGSATRSTSAPPCGGTSCATGRHSEPFPDARCAPGRARREVGRRRRSAGRGAQGFGGPPPTTISRSTASWSPSRPAQADRRSRRWRRDATPRPGPSAGEKVRTGNTGSSHRATAPAEVGRNSLVARHHDHRTRRPRAASAPAGTLTRAATRSRARGRRAAPGPPSCGRRGERRQARTPGPGPRCARSPPARRRAEHVVAAFDEFGREQREAVSRGLAGSVLEGPQVVELALLGRGEPAQLAELGIPGRVLQDHPHDEDGELEIGCGQRKEVGRSC